MQPNRFYTRHLPIFLVLLFLFGLMPGFVPGVQAADNAVNGGSLRHDSRDVLYRSPAGAVPTGTEVRLRLRAADGDLTGASVRVWNDRLDVSTIYPMALVASNVALPNDPGPYEFWEVTLPASADATVYWYRFIATDGSATVYYEDDSARTGGTGQTYTNSPDNSWQLTIYDSAFTTPDWVKNAVIYQIFPDRFRDGDPSNNPSAGEFFYGNFDTIYRSNATAWNTRICDPRVVGGSASVCADAYSQNFYGGDLQGIINQLPYLDNLGVTALYLNPIFESPSNHKYDTTDFFHIDNNFGDLATFQNLVTQANALGIRIILDGVFNHSSSDSIYFDRYDRWNQTGSSPANPVPVPVTPGTSNITGACETNNPAITDFVNWYTFFNFTGAPPSPCSDNRDYPKWFGIFDSLPVLQHDYPAVRDYFINNGVASVGPYWAQWVDGWRLDVAPEIDHGTINDPLDDYWEDFRAAVRAVNPDMYIVGEEWGNPTSWTIGGEWDATMNYQFAAAVLSFWRDNAFTDNDFNSGSSAGTLNPLNPTAVNERLLNLEERYAAPAFYAMMNLFNSHDTNRVLFLLDHNTGTNNTALYNDPNYDWSDAITRLRGAVLMQMTLPGAPTIYYGDEVGTVNPPAFDGSRWQDDPYNRVPYPWLDETGIPYYVHMQTGGPGSVRDQLFNYYQELIAIRQANPALRTGSFDPLLLDDGNDVYVYGRRTEDDSNVAIIVANGAGSARNVTVDVSSYVPAGTTLTDVLNGGTVSVASDGSLTVNAPARGGNVFIASTFAGQRPQCVLDLAATPAMGQVDLTWSAVANATSYDVYRSQVSGGGYLFLGNTSGTTYSDTTPDNATTYFYTLIAKNDTTLLASDLGCGNEVSATPTLSITWANLQWPPDIGNGNAPQPYYELSATTPTTEIYGQVYIAGVTDTTPGQVAGVTAQVGYGPAGVAPSDPQWTWFPMSFQGEAGGGNNDEYVGNLLPTAIGSFRYTTRWSTDGGATWLYTDRVAPPYDELDSGLLVVSPPGDTTPPAVPTNLAVTGTTDTSVSLAWDVHPNTDGDLYGFRVYRENTASPGYSVIDTVVGAGATTYTDTSVTSAQNYNYTITALDNATNESAQSNVVNATAELRMVDVTFSVSVPDPSPGTIHIAGSFNGWNPGDPSHTLVEVSPGVWEITLSILDSNSIEYKYTRGTWETVEKEADGNAEVANRTHTASYGTTGTETVNNTVLNWRDPLVVAFVPSDGSTGVAPTASINLTWNQAVPDNLSSAVIVTGPAGPVTGTWSTTGNPLTSSFIPDAPLADGNHTVSVSGATDVAGDVQQAAQSVAFSVSVADINAPSIPTNLTITDSQSTSVTLGWDAHPNTDGDLAGFGIWRADNGGSSVQIDTVADAAAVSYVDTSVSGGNQYSYTITAVDADGNESAPSNAANTTTPLGVPIDWANLQWPPTITHVVSAVNPTPAIYGQVYIAGYTGAQNLVDPTPGLIAELGYGADGTLPTDASWQWTATTFNVNAGGNNDEYMGSFTITVPGSYDYLYRYSTDGGATWTYGTLAGPVTNLAAYNPADAGQLTVNASADTTPPLAPTNLVVTGESAAQVDLAWDAHPNVDGDLFAFELYREDAASPGYALLDTITDIAATSYSDTSVVSGASYNYYLVAVDTSTNASVASNIVGATAQSTIDVTFTVMVPNHTPTSDTVYLVGNFDSFAGSPYPAWNPSGIAMTETGPDTWQVTLTGIPNGTNLEYKYTRGSWETVEKETDGNADILSGGNRTLAVSAGSAPNDTVSNWRDPYIVSITPADGASANSSTTIAITWNQAMPATPGGVFTVTHSVDGAITGTISYDAATATHTFTPDNPLTVGSITVAVSGNTDVAGDVQQVAENSTFTVQALTITWGNLQWPPTINYTINALTPTDTVYGQLYIPGFTDTSNTPVAGVIAQVGYGADGTSPDDPVWVWSDMIPNPGYDFNQNNDEYQGEMQPDTPGTYDYLIRYSVDGGTTWVYGAYNSTFNADLTAYDPANAGDMTVSTSSDTTAPVVPTNLSITAENGAQITLGWDAHPNTDGDLYAFEIYRDDGSGFVLLDTVTDPTATAYTDTTVAALQSYDYYVVAVDTSFNQSAASNVVTGTARLSGVLVTFTVNVPAHTPGTVYIAGNFDSFVNSPYPAWDPAGIALSEVSTGVWEVTLDLPDAATFEYKFARGSWETVEKEADGNTDILGGGNRPLRVADSGARTMAVNDTVINWRDPYITAIVPADGDTITTSTVDILITWNQDVPADISANVAVLDPTSNPVSGTWSYDAGTFTHTFVPDNPFDPGTYTIDVTGVADVAGDIQQVAGVFSFTYDDTPPTTPSTTPPAEAGPGSSISFADMLGILFVDSDNFAARGGSVALSVIFENLTGQTTKGSLVFTLSDGVSVEDVQTTHGTVAQFEGSIILRVDDVTLNPGEQLVLSLSAIVDETFSGSAVSLKAEWLANNQQLASKTALLIVEDSLLTLPNTGEAPFWRDGLAVLGLLLGGLLLFSVGRGLLHIGRRYQA